MLLIVFAFQGRTVVVFPRFFCWDSIWNFIICANISLRSSNFLDFKKISIKKKLFFWMWGSFFFFSKYPQKSRLITVCVCRIFCTTQNCKRQIKFFSLKCVWGGRKKNMKIPFWLRDNITYGLFLFLKYLLSDTLRRLYNLIPCSCLTKILYGSLYAGTLL